MNVQQFKFLYVPLLVSALALSMLFMPSLVSAGDDNKPVACPYQQQSAAAQMDSYHDWIMLLHVHAFMQQHPLQMVDAGMGKSLDSLAVEAASTVAAQDVHILSF